jgi:DNA repair exonuclease SbcCD ATPase subunit
LAKAVEQSKNTVKTLEEHQKAIEVQLKADSDAYQNLSEFYKSFTNFKNAIRNDEIAELSENMNRKIDMLSGVNLEISGTKIVKGVEKNCVNCKINGDEGGYKSLSSGEKLRVNLAFIWAKRDGYIYKGNGINLFCIDELIKAADKTVINNIFDFLGKEGMTSMVISHGKTEDYDGCITKVIKDSKGSVIEQERW